MKAEDESKRRGIQKAVIPAAGLGSRLWPLTFAVPKELLPLGRKPALQHIMEELLGAGLGQILLITGPGKGALEHHVSALQEKGREAVREQLSELKLHSVRQNQQAGLGDAVARAEVFIGDEAFVVALGDSVIVGDAPHPLVERLIRAHRKGGFTATIAVESVPPEKVTRYGIVRPAESLEKFAPSEPVLLADIVEKPAQAEAPSTLAVAARYVFTPTIFEALRQVAPGHQGEIQLTDAIRWLIREGHAVGALRLRHGERRHDIGSFEGYFRAFLEFILADDELGPGLREHLLSLLSKQTASSEKLGQ